MTTAQDASPASKTIRVARLRYANESDRGFHRRKQGRSIVYQSGRGHQVSDSRTLRRIQQLALPPAWTDVWICADPRGHLQATGRDVRGRKQYRYHADWVKARDESKFDRLVEFGKILPKVRATARRHMAEKAMSKRKVLATLVTLLETTLIRVGNEEYAKSNKSFGLTTLQDRHVDFSTSAVRFQFKGKSGREWKLKVSNRRVANIVKRCQDLPGQHLFQYVGEDGSIGKITSVDVNSYLQQIAGEDFSAKDFRTWAGTVLAAIALQEFDRFDSQAAAKRNVRTAVERVAARLGNTAAICRKSYIHPDVLNSYMDGTLIDTLQQKIRAELRKLTAKLPPEEAVILAFLHGRLARMKKANRSTPSIT